MQTIHTALVHALALALAPTNKPTTNQTTLKRQKLQRLKERLSILAISVMNWWPNVKLRVTEGWDEDMKHSAHSLHYEGRAVDITTSDRDQTKYGMLARLAVEAGFDWVHYEARSHVHCSVKSERADRDSIKSNGCFHAKSLVQTPRGQMEMCQLQTNDLVLAMDSHTGELKFSPVMLWLDRDELSEQLFVELNTKSGRQIRLTQSHLIYVANENPFDLSNKQQSPVVDSATNSGNNIHYDFNDQLHMATTTTNNFSTSEATKQQVAYTVDWESTKVPAQRQPQPAAQQMAADDSAGHVDSRVDLAQPTFARDLIVGQYLLSVNGEDAVADQLRRRQQEARASQTGFDDVDPETTMRAASSSSPGRLTFSSLEPGDEGLAQASDDLNEDFDGSPMQTAALAQQASGPAASKEHQNQLQQEEEEEERKRREIAPGISFDQIVSIKYVTRDGIYAPLTREGNIVVDSVVASCYALISDHSLAHASFAPIRWLNYLSEWLFGQHQPETPTERRTVGALSASGFEKVDRRRAPPSVESRQASMLVGSVNEDLSEEARERSIDHHHNHHHRKHRHHSYRKIHWYPMALYKIGRFLLPSGYLY